MASQVAFRQKPGKFVPNRDGIRLHGYQRQITALSENCRIPERQNFNSTGGKITKSANFATDDCVKDVRWRKGGMNRVDTMAFETLKLSSAEAVEKT